MTEHPFSVVVADDDVDTREHLSEVLHRIGYQAVTVCDGGQLVEMCQQATPDLVLADVKMPVLDGIDAAAVINRGTAVPVILLSGSSEEQLVSRALPEANVMTYLIKPVGEEKLKTAIPLAIARFRQAQALSDESAVLRQSLEDRKIIERAKGNVMKRLRLSEDEAFRRLRMLASSNNRKLVETCRQVNAADEVYQGLDTIGQRGAG